MGGGLRFTCAIRGLRISCHNVHYLEIRIEIEIEVANAVSIRYAEVDVVISIIVIYSGYSFWFMYSKLSIQPTTLRLYTQFLSVPSAIC